jgi:hypothetical protein
MFRFVQAWQQLENDSAATVGCAALLFAASSVLEF